MRYTKQEKYNNKSRKKRENTKPFDKIRLKESKQIKKQKRKMKDMTDLQYQQPQKKTHKGKKNDPLKEKTNRCVKAFINIKKSENIRRKKRIKEKMKVLNITNKMAG